MNTESGAEHGQGDPDHWVQAAEKERRARRRIRWLGLLGVVVVAAGMVGIAYWQSRPTALETAYESCGYDDEIGVRLADGGRTLLLETVGEEDSFGIEYLDLFCTFSTLQMPARVTTQITATRALDGRVTDAWDNYTAAWSYHPRSGLDLMITID